MESYCSKPNPILPDDKDNVWELESQHLNWVRAGRHINLNQSETNIERRKVLYIFKCLPKIAFTLELLLCDCQKYLEWFEVLGEN